MKAILSYISPVATRLVQVPFVKQAVIAAFLLVCSSFALSQELIKDINRDENPQWSEYNEAVDLNNVLYYTSGRELWKTTGTRAASFRIKQFKALHTLTSALGKLYFVANDGAGDELWKSDGTNAGTLKVKDIWPGPSGSLPEKFIVMGTQLYFVANDGVHGKELWKTDGSSSGTLLVKDILPRLGGGNPSYLTNVNGVLFFSASNGSEGNELWKSDGTAAGTVMIRDIKPGSKVSSFPKHITNVNGVLYFSAIDSESGRELWKSDGTAEGTVRIRDIVPGAIGTNMLNFTAVKSTLFFSANDRIHGEELWKSDGTSSGTVMVKDLTPGSKGSSYRDAFSFQFTGLKNINGTLYFNAYRNDAYYCWKSDGTEAGTIPFSYAGTLGISQIRSSFTLFNNCVFFYRGSSLNDDIQAVDLMKEDAAGVVTHVSTLALNGFYSSFNQLLVKSGSYLYLTGRKDPSVGYALFRSDGTTAGLQQVIDNVSLKNLSSSPASFLKIGNIVYFTANILDLQGIYTNSLALWSTDGTTAGTRFIFNLTKDLIALLNINGVLHFIDYKDGRIEIFLSDGTTAGTKVIPTPRPADAQSLRSFAYTDGKFFLMWGGGAFNTPHHLWTTDGTTARSVYTFDSGSGGGFNNLVVVNNIVYFQGSKSALGNELWRSDGTESGTYLVKDIWPGAEGSWPDHLTAFQNNLYFSANDGVNGYELWRSNGTPSGTFMLKNISTTNDDVNGRPEKFLEVNDQLYFTFKDREDCWLWKTDGTPSGTTLMKKVDGIYSMINGADQLYFLSYSSTTKLWTSKGTPLTTQLVKDFGPNGFVGSTIMIGSILYLNGNNTIHRSDGTECGTFPLNIALNSAWYEFRGTEAINDDLILGAFRTDIGQELFKINTANISVPVCDEATFSFTGINQTASYPNPFASEFSLEVEGPEGGSYNVQIFDLDNVLIDYQGALQYNTKYLLGTWLRKGSYVLKINEGNKSSVKRIIKN
jgi:ELWxxDGT repeat protein